MENMELTGKIIGAAIEVHKELGPGLLESAYEECLLFELRQKGMVVERQQPLPVSYKSICLEFGFRMDLVVEKTVVLEIKSVEALNDVHLAQLLTYLKFGNFQQGLLINFNVIRLKDGLRRVINSRLRGSS